MIIHTLMTLLLFLSSTQTATETNEPNVFIDLGTEHCAEEIAIAAYENTAGEGITDEASPAFATYSAFEFGSPALAVVALDDLPRLVAETYVGEDVIIGETMALDAVAREIPAEDDDGERLTYMFTLPVGDGEVLFVDMLAVAKESQLLVILLFDSGTSILKSPSLAAEPLRPFTAGIDEVWTGDGDLEDAVPDEDEMPPGWVGRDVTTAELPPCEQARDMSA